MELTLTHSSAVVLPASYRRSKLLNRSSDLSQRSLLLYYNRITRKSARSALVVAMAAKRKAIDGVSTELNAIASRNIDFASARRSVREAFTPLQQQLDHLLFKMAPSGIRTEEVTGNISIIHMRHFEGYEVLRPYAFNYKKNSRGLEIFCKKWLPEPRVPMKGILCFCHGYGDTCTFFFEGIAKHIAAAGYGVYALDYPGFGLSEGLHGYIPSFDQLVDDVIEHYTNIKSSPENSGISHFLLGQSMGGAVALKVHLKQPQAWDGVVLVAPMCKIADDVTPPKTVQVLMTLLSKVLPSAKLLPVKDLAELAFRDPVKRELTAYNVISYSGRVRLKTAVELLKTTGEIESQVEKVCAPLLILHGAADKVTDPLVSKFLYEKASSQDKNLKLYEGGYHSILEGESDERILTVIKDIISWLDSHSH